MNENIVLPAPALAPVAPPMPKQGLIKLSPLNRRRLKNFKANRRGYWSFWIFVVLFVLSLFAEFLANDKPILVSYKGELLSPVLTEYPEEKFGGFLAVTDYRDPVISKEIEANGWILWAPIRFSYNTHNLDLPVPAPAPPTWMLDDAQCRSIAERNGGTGCRDIEWNWLGTDDQGRDVVARLIYGFRISVLFGLILAGISSVVGVLAGAVQGYFGGWVDLLFQRFIEVWTAIPALVSAASSYRRSSHRVSSFCWASFCCFRGFRWLASSVPNSCAPATSNTCALHALWGCPTSRIMFRHLLPNAMVATLTFLPFILNGSIATLTSLDFLGFGLPPGSPSLGEMLAQGKANLQAPWLGLTGFFVIALMLSLLIFIGEAVRDAFDPRKAFQ